MLRIMREQSQSFFIYAIFIVLIVVFAFSFGPGSGSCGGATVSDWAARVDGEVIPRDEYAILYNQQVESFRRSGGWGGGANMEAMLEQLNLRRRTIDELINTRLAAHEAKRRGLLISDDELRELLTDRYGVPTDPKEYERWVRMYYRTTPLRFESRVRDQLAASRLQQVISDTVAVSDEELKVTYTREHDRVMINIVRFDPRSFGGGGAATEEEINALLASDSEAVRARYDAEPMSYRKPKQVRARQIVKSLPADASDADKARIRGELTEISAQLKAGADFAALAKEVSDDPVTKEKGGDLGFVQIGQMAPAIVNKLYAMAVDEITEEPIETRQGLHLLQVLEIKPSTRQPFEEVQREVAAKLVNERKGKTVAKQAAEELWGRIKQGEKLEDLTWTDEERRAALEEAPEASGKEKPIRRESPWILKSQESLPGIGDSSEIKNEVFALTAEDPVAKKVHEVNDIFYVVTLKEREVPDLTQFEGQKESLRTRLLSTKQGEVRNAWLQHLRKNAQVELNPEIFPSAAEEQPAAKEGA